MRLPVEIQRAEILDWWEAAYGRISEAVPDRLPALLYKVDQEIAEMPVSKLLYKGNFLAEAIEPLISSWISKIYQELTTELDGSLRASFETVEGEGAVGDWTYSEMAVAGAAIAVSAAPLAGVPFFVSGFTVASLTIAGFTFGGGALMALPVVVAAGSAVLLAAGPSLRSKAVESLKSRFRTKIHKEIESRVLGDPGNIARPSLKGILLSELYGVAMKRMDMVE